jgi:hypothetical protein
METENKPDNVKIPISCLNELELYNYFEDQTLMIKDKNYLLEVCLCGHGNTRRVELI